MNWQGIVISLVGLAGIAVERVFEERAAALEIAAHLADNAAAQASYLALLDAVDRCCR